MFCPVKGDRDQTEHNLQGGINNKEPVREAVQHETQYASGGKSEHEHCASGKSRARQGSPEGAAQPEHDHSQVKPHHRTHDVSEVGRIDGDAEEGIKGGRGLGSIAECDRHQAC